MDAWFDRQLLQRKGNTTILTERGVDQSVPTAAPNRSSSDRADLASADCSPRSWGIHTIGCSNSLGNFPTVFFSQPRWLLVGDLACCRKAILPESAKFLPRPSTGLVVRTVAMQSNNFPIPVGRPESRRKKHVRRPPSGGISHDRPWGDGGVCTDRAWQK